jgi:hypothetical protein
VLIIVVFDPLAVLMLIAANQGLKEWREGEPTEPKKLIETLLDPIPDESSAEPMATESQTVTLTIEGKDEHIAAVEGLRTEMAALNAAIAAPTVKPEPELDLNNLSGMAHAVQEPQNHTFDFAADTGIVTIATADTVEIIETVSDDQSSFDFDTEPEVLVKLPVAADIIEEDDLVKLAHPEESGSQWQIIDQLPAVQTTETKTVHEFFDELRDMHKLRIDQHLSDKSQS